MRMFVESFLGSADFPWLQLRMRRRTVPTKLGIADDVVRVATVNDGDGPGKAMGEAVAWVRTG